MIKRMLLIGGGAVLVSTFLFGRDVASYVRTSATCVRDTVQSSVPIDFQIQRARTMIEDLVPEVKKNMHVIAKEEVDIRRLEEQIEGAAANLGKEKAQIMQLKGDLASGKNSFRYGDRDYTGDEVKSDLAHRFERYKTNEATLASLHARFARPASTAWLPPGKNWTACSPRGGNCRWRWRTSKHGRKWWPRPKPPAITSSTIANWAGPRNWSRTSARGWK